MAGNGNYEPVSSSPTIVTLALRPITITADDESITYGATISQSYAITSGSLAVSDVISGLTYTYVGTGSTTYGPSTSAPTGGGTYSVTPSAAVFSTGAASSYDITYELGEVSIARASQTITFTYAGGTKTYGDANFSIAADASTTSSLTVTFESATPAVCSITGTTVSIVAAGSCTITAVQAGNANFLPAAPVDQMFTVSPRSITVTADNDTITYGGTLSPGLRVTSGSLVGSDAISSATYSYRGTGSTTYGPSTTAPTNAGDYLITPSAAVFAVGSASNYTITYVAGVVEIEKANQNIAFTSSVPTSPDPGTSYTPTAVVLSAFSELLRVSRPISMSHPRWQVPAPLMVRVWSRSTPAMKRA
jgi:hypothetical protein